VPSKIVVMENIGKNAKGNSLPVTSLAVREDYTSLKKVVIDKKHPIPLDLEMARYAVAAAETAGAKEFATAAFDRARGALASAEAEFTSKKSAERQRVEEDSREAIQAGEDARAGAEVRRNSLKYIAQADLIKERDKTIADEQAKSAHLQADLDSARQKLAALQKLLPSASTRVALAGDVLSKWFTVPPPTDAGEHVPERHQGIAAGHEAAVVARNRHIARHRRAQRLRIAVGARRRRCAETRHVAAARPRCDGVALIHGCLERHGNRVAGRGRVHGNGTRGRPIGRRLRQLNPCCWR
jgi:hypothetical protein